MAGEYNRFKKNAKPYLQELDSPLYRAEALDQDLHPANIQELREAIADPRHRGRMQQRVLGDELKRIQSIQTHQIQQAIQALPQHVSREITPAKTGEPWPTPEATVIRIMLQMRNRYPGMGSNVPQWNATGAGQGAAGGPPMSPF